LGFHRHDFVTVMVALSRVTIIGSSKRLDVSLPDGVPVAELMLDLVQMLDESSDSVPARWALLRVGGRPLDPEQSLAEQGVASGTMLFVRDLTAETPPPAIDDFAQSVAITVDAQTSRWTAGMFRPLLAAASATCLLVAGVALLVAGDRGQRSVAGVVGAALASLGGLALVRLAGRRDFAAVITVATLPLWAAAGTGLAAFATADRTGVLAAAAMAIAVGAVVALLIAGDSALAVSSGVIAATLLPAFVLGGCQLFGIGVVSAAAILCPLGLAASAVSTPLAARLGGVTTADGMSLERDVRRGRRMSAALLIGIAVVLVVSSIVLAVSGGWFAWGLIAATAAAAGAQARHHRFAAEVAPLLVVALAGVLLLEFPLVAQGGAAVLVTLLIADGLVLTALAGAIGRPNLPANIQRRLGTIEWIAIAASVPLAAGVIGFYDAVVRFARGLS
jgi:type VII secretion integral membrane protein EccD